MQTDEGDQLASRMFGAGRLIATSDEAGQPTQSRWLPLVGTEGKHTNAVASGVIGRISG